MTNLTDKIAAQKEALKSSRRYISELEVERDRLKAALRPFALAADVTDDLAAGIGLDEIMSSLSVGDLRHARAALSGKGVTT